jgi:HlyD family secretion protein
MRRTGMIGVAMLASIGVAATLFTQSRAPGSQTSNIAGVKAAEPSLSLIAAPGRIEPISEEIKVSAEIRGKIKEVHVEEGDFVRPGQLVATLENDDYRAQVASAQARLAQKEAELRRIVNGARLQERREAWENAEAAKAELDNSLSEMESRRSLFARGVIAKEEADRAERVYRVARARYDSARQRHSFIDDDAREEDRAQGEAEVGLSRAQLDEARARYEKSFVRAPIAGVVLRKHMKNGESVSDMREMPIITMADVSTLCVRVDVDETDIGKIRVGQKAYVTADAFPGEKFYGRIVRIGQILGKKNIRTDEPSERIDTKILETVIELEDGKKLSPGLRVDSYLMTSAN